MCSLSNGSSLQDGKYIITSKISQEGLHITYQALQTSLNRTVVIREFYMRDFCSREKDSNNIIVGIEYSKQVDVFKIKFLSDAKSDARGETDSDLKILDIFEENNTAYYVFLDNDDIDVEKENSEPIDVAVEETQIVDSTQDTKHNDLTTIEINNADSIQVVDPSIGRKTLLSKKIFGGKYQKAIIVSVAFVIIGFICALIYLSGKYGYSDSSMEVTDSLGTIFDDTLIIDSIAYELEMQSDEQATILQQEFEEYINLSNEWLAKAQNSLHKPSNVQNILNARYYYYDKADKINVALKGERLPAHKDIDNLTEQEYQYWVEEAKKCGSAKNKYELKTTAAAPAQGP